MLGILLFSASLFLLCASTIAAEKRYVMKGEIRAIELDYNTVVIEVPLGKKMFTVGGPLSSNAVLKKRGRLAKLADFLVGEVVTVRWKATEKGHIIEGLEGK